MESAAEAVRQLTFQQKLNMPGRATASGCETNVEFALQLLQPHVFPELLRTDYYRNTAMLGMGPMTDVGSPAVASGLAHLLPSLEQHCPGLLIPGRTLEEAAQHCDLAGLQAAWEVLGQRLRRELSQRSPGLEQTASQAYLHQIAQAVWRRIMAAAAGSPTPDSIVKMEWALDKGHAYADPGARLEHADVCGAAAASGDLARVRWLRQRGGFPWGTAETLAAVMQHADLAFIQVLEDEGGYLPPVGDQAWSRHDTAMAAAAATRHSAAKLHWLAGRVLQPLETKFLVPHAALFSNWEALAVLLVPEHRPPLAPPGAQPLPADRLQRVSGMCFECAFSNGDVDMLRWLLQMGCDRNATQSLHAAVGFWPADTPVRCSRLVEALRLLAAAGWPVVGLMGTLHPLVAAAYKCHPWPVWRTLLELLPAGPQPGANVPIYPVKYASAAGCEATLEALVGLGFGGTGAGRDHPSVADDWYLRAARNGDLGTLTALRRLGVPIRAGVLEPAVKDHAAPLPALQWLVQQGAPWSPEGVRGAMRWMSDNQHRRPPEEQRQVMAWLRSLLGAQQAEGRP